MKTFALFFAFCASALGVFAGSITVSKSLDGASITVRLDVDNASGFCVLSGSSVGIDRKLEEGGTYQYTSPSWEAGYLDAQGGRHVLTDGSSYAETTIANSSAFSAEVDMRARVPAGGLLFVSVRIVSIHGASYYSADGSSYETVADQKTLGFDDDLKFYVVLHLPAGNGSDHLFFAYQGDTQIGFYQVGALDLARDIRLGPLETDAPVGLKEVLGGFVDTDAGTGNNPRAAADGSTKLGPSINSTPLPGTDSSGGSSVDVPLAPTVKPANPTAPAAGVETPVAPPAPPIPPTLAQGGSGGATGKEIVGALDEVNKAAAVNSAAIVAAVNSGTAVSTTNTNALVKSVNGLLPPLDRINANLEKQSLLSLKKTEDALAKIDTSINNAKSVQVDTLTELKKITNQGPFDSASALVTARAQGVASGSYSGPVVAGTVGTGAAVTFSGAGDELPSVEMVVGNKTIVLGALPAFATGGFNILIAGRALLLFALCVWFVRSSSSTVEAYVVGLSLSGSSGSNLVGVENMVPGVSLAKHLASASSIIVVILACCAAIVALIDVSLSRYGAGLSGFLSAVNLSALGPGIGYIDNFIPVAASITLTVLRAAVGYLVAPLYLTATSLARVLHV